MGLQPVFFNQEMLQVEITKFSKMEEVLTVLFTFSGQNAAQCTASC